MEKGVDCIRQFLKPFNRRQYSTCMKVNTESNIKLYMAFVKNFSALPSLIAQAEPIKDPTCTFYWFAHELVDFARW